MKFSRILPTGLAAMFALSLIAGCATNNEPEKDPIFDVTPGGQNQQQSRQ